MTVVPAAFRDLIAEESCAIAYLATTQPDGSPILSPVWFGPDGDDHLLIVTYADSLKARNMHARPQVAIVLQDPEDTYRYLQVRGHVIESHLDPARAKALMQQFSWRYLGKAYPFEIGDDIIFRIKIEHANGLHITH